jgi:hypothetical protein
MVIVGRIVVSFVGLLMLINASVMLVSPRAWFGLPRWLRATGSMTEEKYSTGWGAIQVQITGALLLSVLGWVIYDMFFSR